MWLDEKKGSIHGSTGFAACASLETRRLVADFLSWKLHNQGRSRRTVRAYGAALERLLVFFDGRDPRLATPDELTMFTGPWLHKQGVQAVSRRPYVAAVREFYQWLAAYRHIASDPAEATAYPSAGQKLPRVMSLLNAERLMWAPDFATFEGVRDGAILGVLMGCGLRVSGLVALNQGNIIHAEHKGEIRMLLRVLEKGEKERVVPVPRETDLLLRIYLEHPVLQAIDRITGDGDQVLFVSTRNRNVPPHEYHGEKRRLSQWSVRDMIQRYGQRVGIPKEQLHPHALRHLFGTELAESRVDLLERQELMGHADPKSTKIYTRIAARRLIENSDAANPLAKMRTPVSDLMAKLRKASK